MLVVNDLNQLKAQFTTKQNLYNQPPFEIISEISLVSFNSKKENDDLQNYRKNINKFKNKKDK